MTPHVYAFHEKQIRVAVKEGEPWFALADVAKALGIKNQKDFLDSSYCDPKGVDQTYLLSAGGRQKTTLIDEGNLNVLVIRSDKPEAIPLIRWIGREVLPSIRKTGGYQFKPGPSQLPPGSRAQEWLKSALKDGRRPFQELETLARASMINRPSLYVAMQKLNINVEAVQESGRWVAYWSLPAQ